MDILQGNCCLLSTVSADSVCNKSKSEEESMRDIKTKTFSSDIYAVYGLPIGGSPTS